MTKIFVSYRRDDSADITGRIYDRLVGKFGRDIIFRDVDSIPLGVDFRAKISEQVTECSVLLAVIGTQWISITDQNGNRRLDNPDDYVRIEIEAALSRGIPVIPVLVQHAAMPTKDELPEPLANLVFQNAAVARRDPDFHSDLDRLIRDLESKLEAAISGDVRSSVGVVGISGTLTNTLIKSPATILPHPFEWCHIPKGKVTLEDAREHLGNNGGTIEIVPFRIAKYPITNAQYQIFVDAKDGYSNAFWWEFSPEAKQWHLERMKSREQLFIGDDLPRTDVSWFDAMAFCYWLNMQLVAGMQEEMQISPIFGKVYSLPTERQWQRAAIGDTGWEYPWGNDFDQNCCNTSKTGLHMPKEVGEYPNGASPYGVMNMSGNIWEWCRNEWGVEDVRLGGNNERVVRGGSWNNSEESAKATIRFKYSPSYEFGDTGFRIVQNL